MLGYYCVFLHTGNVQGKFTNGLINKIKMTCPMGFYHEKYIFQKISVVIKTSNSSF